MDLPLNAQVHRGGLFYLTGDPGLDGSATNGNYVWHADGILIVAGGRVHRVGAAAELLPLLPAGVPINDWQDSLLVPGFIDAHIHFPQLDIVASYGEQLLTWLNEYTFPAEMRFGEQVFASASAETFLDMLLCHGTTSAMAFCTSHASSADALFAAARKRNLRMIAGKVMMDRNAPPELRDSVSSADLDCRRLIRDWHGTGRLEFALTPRFAPTSSIAQLTMAGRLLRDYPGLPMQTHLAENQAEVAWIKELFPERSSYLDVYAHYGLLRERCVFAHSIHIDDIDRAKIAQAHASTAFCPTSNTFLGSGLFDLKAAHGHGILVSLATDVGAGTSISMLQTMGEAYRVCQLQNQKLHPMQAFYLATLGNARALGIDGYVGNLEPQKEADFLVLNTRSTPLLKHKHRTQASLPETLFNLMMLGDDRAIRATYVAGNCLYKESVPSECLGASVS